MPVPGKKQQAKRREKSRQDFSLCGPSVLTPALLASIIPNQNNFGITTVLAIPHDGGSGVTEELKACDPLRWVGLMNTLKAQVKEVIRLEKAKPHGAFSN